MYKGVLFISPKKLSLFSIYLVNRCFWFVSCQQLSFFLSNIFVTEDTAPVMGMKIASSKTFAPNYYYNN